MLIYKFANQSWVFIALNRPQSRNALNLKLLDDLNQALHEVDDSIKGVVISGSEGFFCSGMDLKELTNFRDQNRQDVYLKSFRSKFKKVLDRLHSLKAMTFSFVEGGAYGGGVGLAFACDVCCATRESVFCLSELKHGVLPVQIMPVLSKRLNSSMVLRMLLTSQPLESSKLGDDLLMFHGADEFKEFIESNLHHPLPKLKSLIKKHYSFT